MRFRVSFKTIVAMTAVALLSAVTYPATVQGHPAHEVGLGAYGTEGPIERSALDVIVDDEAIELAQSEELSAARQKWDVELDFVAQIDYQLKFRQQFDFLSSEATHIATLLEEKPVNYGIESIRLYLTSDEATELQRRLALGDLIPKIETQLGEQSLDTMPEGATVEFSSNFGGVYQDQQDQGAIVVAVVDSSKVDREVLEEIVGGPENLRLIEVDHSWAEVDEFRDTALRVLGDRGIPADVFINSTGEGRLLEVISPKSNEVAEILENLLPATLFDVAQGDVAVEAGAPRSTHNEAGQTPGLAIEFDGGGWCTWGVNMHTNTFNYIATAGHCGDAVHQGFSGYSTALEIHQNNSFHLTPGSQYVYSLDAVGWDMKRVSSPQADSNYYHPGGDFGQIIYRRAQHNSWEVNSDITCASLGATNDYRCGLVIEENYVSTSGGCAGSRWMRTAIAGNLGDSGAGFVSPTLSGPPSRAAIDGLVACIQGTSYAFGNTAYDVKQQLGADFNCSSSVVVNAAPASWPTCSTTNR